MNHGEGMEGGGQGSSGTPAPSTGGDGLQQHEQQFAGAGGTYDPSNPYLYTDEAGYKWQWDLTTQAWLPQAGQEQQPALEQQVWLGDDDIPPIPADMPTSSTTATAPAAGAGRGKKRKGKGGQPPKPGKTTTVYVSGLPLDMTKEELLPFMAKCGIVRKDPDSGEYKVKLYEDEQGRLKGDALVVYFKRESVDLALQLLDESEIRPGCVVRVTEAKFENKPDSEQAKPKAKKPVGKKKQKKKVRINQEEELSWVEWETRRHVIIKNMFSPEEAIGDDEFYPDLKNDVREEVEKFGEVEVLTVFERNPEGVVAIKFVEPEAAVKCLEVMNGRFFAKRQLVAEWYDGVTNYKVKETEADQKHRLDAFGDWLENQSSSEDEDDEDA